MSLKGESSPASRKSEELLGRVTIFSHQIWRTLGSDLSRQGWWWVWPPHAMEDQRVPVMVPKPGAGPAVGTLVDVRRVYGLYDPFS